MASSQGRYVWAAPLRPAQPRIRLVQPAVWTPWQPLYISSAMRGTTVLVTKPIPSSTVRCQTVVKTSPAVLPHLLRRTLPAKAASKLPEANVAKPQSQEDKAALPQMEVRVEEAPTEPLATSTPKKAPPTEVVEVAVKDEDVGRKQQDLEEEFPCPKGKPISYGPPVPLQVAAAQPQRAEPAAPVQPAETPAMEEEAEQTDEEAQALVRLQAALEVFQKMEGAGIGRLRDSGKRRRALWPLLCRHHRGG